MFYGVSDGIEPNRILVPMRLIGEIRARCNGAHSDRNGKTKVTENRPKKKITKMIAIYCL